MGFTGQGRWDRAEISHKIAERIACFLESISNEREIIFKQIKIIYGVRSKIVHGAEIKKMSKGLSYKMLSELESLTQRIIKKILQDQILIDNFSGKPDQREKFLQSLLFC